MFLQNFEDSLINLYVITKEYIVVSIDLIDLVLINTLVSFTLNHYCFINTSSKTIKVRNLFVWCLKSKVF